MVLKKHIQTIGLIVLMLITGCTQNNSQNKDHLIYWSSNNSTEIEFSDYLVTKWNQAHPDEPFSTQPVPEGRSSEEVILAAVVGRTTPDIYSNMWQGDVEFFARSGVLVPLDTLDGFMEMLNDRCDSMVIAEVTSSDGHIYQVPWKINPIMLIYNITMFGEIGWRKPPKTYSEFLKAAEAFHRDNDGNGYVDTWIGYSEVLSTWWQRFFDFYPLYLAASGGAKLVENQKVVFNNIYAIEVFEFLKILYDRNYFSREILSARQDVFLSGIIATRFTGPWEIIRAEKFKRDDFYYDFSALPRPDDHTGPVYTYGDPKNIVIFNTCKNPDLAWRFIREMIIEENDLKLLEYTTQLPRRKNLFGSDLFRSYFEHNPKMVPFAEQAEYVRGTDVSPQLKEVFDIISQEYEACVIYGTKTAAEAVASAAQAAQVILN